MKITSQLAQLLPEHQDELIRLSKMESRHKKGFEACGRNLKVVPDLQFAQKFFCRTTPKFPNSSGRR